MQNTICHWRGQSGALYTYRVYAPYSTTWNPVPGNYIFAALVDNRWYARYIGETQDFCDRLPAHDKWLEAVGCGATYIHARVNSLGRSSRLGEEADLIQLHQPECNVQMKSPFASTGLLGLGGLLRSL